MVYPFNEKRVVIRDIFRRVGVKTKQIKNRLQQKSALLEYYITDGETPEQVSMAVYGTPSYHWAILVINDIVNVKEEWPIHENDMFEYVEDKYGVNNATEVHHYILAETSDDDEQIVVDYNPALLATGDIEEVSNYEYEVILNNNKRSIFVLRPDEISGFASEYKKLISVN